MVENRKVMLAGVPALVRPPQDDIDGAPLIVLWHGYGPPASEQALAELLPLDEVAAWKLYPALPLFGERLPEGGMDEIMRRQLSDYVLDLLLPTVEAAVAELPEMIAEAEHQLGVDASQGVGLFGFSAGAAAAILALLNEPLNRSVNIRAAVLAGAPPNLDIAVASFERGTQSYLDYLREHYDWFRDEMMTYRWSAASKAARSQFDLGGRVDELTNHGLPPAVLLMHGEQDEMYSVVETQALGNTLHAAYRKYSVAERTKVKTFPHLAHHLVLSEPNKVERQDLLAFQEAVATWFRQYLLL
ncbi:MAG: hypothetical protein WBA76_04165 [Phormidesmis sp.]